MINILFVDDEPSILLGLRRMLMPMSHEWNMLFAEGGDQALELLCSNSVDVMVSDMKMPGMNGVQLLQAVSESHPEIIRIIHSGYSEKEMIMRSAGTVHQYLSKPCDAETIKATVGKVWALRSLLTNAHLRQLIAQLPTVPSLPMLYGELIDELGKAEPSTQRVGDIVKRDLGMTVKILQLVNSAFFGMRRRVSDSTEAVELLGLETIGSLTLGLGLISQFESQTSEDFLAEVWTHSIAVGILAHKIALAEHREVANDAFTAGLLHDIGKVVLTINLPHHAKAVREIMERDNVGALEAEKQLYGATHSEVGAYLLGLWGLPSHVVQAVAFNRDPSEGPGKTFSAVTAVHIANAIRQYENSSATSPAFDLGYLNDLGLTDKIPSWLENGLTLHP